ncbi:MAG TPA: HhH-GPD-type base excision DNA repair protein [Candidatus Limnocylindrales bacterium]
MATSAPQALPFSGDPEADRLLAADPVALLIGFVLDQQVTLQKAFSGPLELRRRIGTLDPAAIAAYDPDALETAFRERPALHRFPANMARRVQELCATLAADYGGDPTRIWNEAGDAAELERRLRALPGIGDMKAGTILAILGRRFGLRLPGLDDRLPTGPTLGDVDSDEARERYQAAKRERKRALRAASGR